MKRCGLYIRLSLLSVMLLLLAGCATTMPQGSLQHAEFRKYVILGEQVSDEAAVAYANKFNARVFYTPHRGAIAASVVKGLTATVGPSSAMKHLMNELRSMSHTGGEWEIIVPSIAERYVLVALRNMEDGAVVNVNGHFYLCDSNSNPSFVSEVTRVFGNDFEVKFGIE